MFCQNSTWIYYTTRNTRFKEVAMYRLIFGLISYIFGSNAPVAQSVEQIPFKDKVVGSIPTGRTA